MLKKRNTKGNWHMNCFSTASRQPVALRSSANAEFSLHIFNRPPIWAACFFLKALPTATQEDRRPKGQRSSCFLR